MNDPHVISLSYAVNHDDDVDYVKAPPLEWDEADFSVHVEGDRALVTMRTHVATKKEARDLVDPRLRAWELTATLQLGLGQFELEFESAELVDRDPAPPGTTQHLQAELHVDMDAFLTAAAHVSRAKYPDPPLGIARDAAVELMFDRFTRLRRGTITLADAAYFCLTVLELEGGGRRGAARKFFVAEPVFRKLGDLTANKGGRDARKASGATVDYTREERRWLEAAMKTLIRRAAEVAHAPGKELPTITMAELTKLP
jgi:hypothetical protein